MDCFKIVVENIGKKSKILKLSQNNKYGHGPKENIGTHYLLLMIKFGEFEFIFEIICSEEPRKS